MGTEKVMGYDMDLLDSSIQELYRIEPYWNICAPCQCGGCCCIGAEISIYENEWQKIYGYIQTLPVEGKNILISNIKNNRNCVFRADDKCLIHAVRPENCRYTPYQCLVDDENHLKYCQVRISETTGLCEFQSVNVALTETQASVVRENKIVVLPNFERDTKYLSLNWQVANSQPLGLCRKISEWIQIESLMY